MQSRAAIVSRLLVCYYEALSELTRGLRVANSLVSPD